MSTDKFPDRLKVHLNEQLWECIQQEHLAFSYGTDLFYRCTSGNESYRIKVDRYNSAQEAITHELPALRRLAGMS